MHPKDNLLRAFLDDELPGKLSSQVREHVSRCAECSSRINLLRERAGRVKLHLDSLGPVGKPGSIQQAYSRLPIIMKKNQTKKEKFPTMNNRKPLWTALAVVAILAIALTITPVRAWASDFLGLFRVQKITVVQFDPEKAGQVSDSLTNQQDAIQLILDENLEMTEQGEKEPVASVEEAASRAGFTPRLPAALAQANLSFQPGAQARLTIDQPAMQTVLDAIDADVQIPAEMDGQVVTVTVPGAVVASLNCASEANELASDCVELYQMPSPTVDAPEGLNTDEIGAAMLQLLGMSPREARQISQTIDWTSTLVLPVPQDGEIQVSEIQVDGVSGTLLTGPQDNKAMLLWVKDGFVYGLQVPGGVEEAQAIVASMP